MATNRKQLDTLIKAVKAQVGAIDDLIIDIRKHGPDDRRLDWCRRLQRVRDLIAQELDEAEPNGRVLKGLAAVAGTMILAISAGAAEGTASEYINQAIDASAEVEACPIPGRSESEPPAKAMNDAERLIEAAETALTTDSTKQTVDSTRPSAEEAQPGGSLNPGIVGMADPADENYGSIDHSASEESLKMQVNYIDNWLDQLSAFPTDFRPEEVRAMRQLINSTFARYEALSADDGYDADGKIGNALGEMKGRLELAPTSEPEPKRARRRRR